MLVVPFRALLALDSDVGLRIIEDKYGDPKTMIEYVAMAPYFEADDAQSGRCRRCVWA
ncbi:MAG: hypothetical protein ABUL62_19715 [Myxococcales bacterium]